MATPSTASLEVKNDPFTPRQGRDLRWRNVSMSIECDPRHYSHHEEENDKGPDESLTATNGDHKNNDNDVEEQQQQQHQQSVNHHQSTAANKKKPTTTKHILDNVWGEVPAGQTTAILGPSGSGKTSLLNILSGRVAATTTTNGSNHNDNKFSKGSTHTKQNQRLVVTADVRLNNFAVDPSNITVRRSAIAFVAQDDSLQATATVREAILFSAKLRLDCTKYQDDDLEHLTTRMIQELGLTQCQDTIIGSALIKGISGGERKRTSVGVELVTQPSLVFLDEPTSGLDSYSAMQLCKVLKKVATAGSSVLFTIHQPSSEIFKTFDHILLLKSGRLLFSGNVASLAPYFEQRGYAVPDQYNPADWIMHVAQAYSTAELQAAGFFPPPPSDSDWGPAAQPGDNKNEEKKRDLLGNTLHEDKKDAIVRLGWPGQTKLLFAREVTNFGRNKHALKARTAMTVAISLFIGIIFFDVAQTSYANFINVQSTFGSLLMALLANVFSTTLPSLLVFPQERPVFLREYSTDHYSVFSYFMSRLTMEFLVTAVQVTISGTITYFCVGFEGHFGIFYLDLYLLAMTSTALGVLLGSSVEDPSSAIELLPGAIMPQILFAGFFVPPELIPNWLAWLRYICPLTYAVRIALANEFDGRCDDIVEADPSIPNYCETVLDNVGVDVDETWWNWLVLVGMFVGMRIMALINLRRKASKFY